MNPSTKRALRTGYQAVLALIVIIPVLVAGLPVTAQVATIVAAVAAVSKVINLLEDAGLIPAWLKNVPAEPLAAEDPPADLATSQA